MASLSEADQLLLKNNPSLTNADIKTYNVKKTKLFKLTISICAIYGTLAIVILLLTLFSSQGSQIFTEEVRPFTLTFVGGIAVMKGYADEATVTEIIGGVMTLAGAIWSVIAKK